MLKNLKILYVDSDKSYGKSFLDFMIGNHYDVKQAKNLKEAYIQYSLIEPHIVIIDTQFKDGSALNFIQKIKLENPECKVILFSNSIDNSLLIQALELKVDKFIEKSKGLEYFQTQMKSLNFNFEEAQEEVMEEGGVVDLGNNCTYNLEQKELVCDNTQVDLTFQEMELLEVLIQSSGEFVSMEQLQNSIGRYGQTSVETIRTVVRKLRKKTYSEIITNKNKVGYKVTLHKNLIQNEDLQYSLKLSNSLLIIDGKKNKNDLLSYQLSKFGFRSESVYTLSDANEALQVENFDYIIASLNLPDGDTIDFIREQKTKLATKFIIMSDTNDIHYKEYLYFKGILDFILNSNDTKYLALNIYNTIAKIEMNTKHNNILIIEKSKKICEQIKDLLVPRGYQISILNDINKSMDVIQNSDFNLVILDISFEKSFEYIAKIRTTINYSLPFVCLTDTNRSYETVRDAFKNGASECLRKPIFAEEFILHIDQIMDQSKLVSQLLERKKFLESYESIVNETTIVSKTDPKGIITYANKKFCQISGYSQKELLGNSHNIIRHPDMEKELFKELWHTILVEKVIWSGIITNRKKDGVSYTVQTHIMPVIDENQDIVEFIALRYELPH